MFERVLIANRGEVARRIMRSARALGITTVAVFSDADASSSFVTEADEAVRIGPPAARDSYLSIERLLKAARKVDADAVHPGYGFLSESAAFARTVSNAGLQWIGPDAEVLERVSDKSVARKLMSGWGLPVAPGIEITDPDDARAAADGIGYPVIVKPSAGGGGLGMRSVATPAEVQSAVEATIALGQRAFGDGRVLLEANLRPARHIEVQVLGLADGRVIALGLRDCSMQRRYQKVIEESPPPELSSDLAAGLVQAAVRGGEQIGLKNAATFEFLVARDAFWFLEVNPRLQVEHPVTELTTGIDLVAEQFRVAGGAPPGFDPEDVASSGHAIEFRVYAEDPVTYLPSPGTIAHWVEPSGSGVRVDAGYAAGDDVPPFYDPMLAKVCVWAHDRVSALNRGRAALNAFEIAGLKTNLSALQSLLDSAPFTSGSYHTGTLEELTEARSRAE